MPDPCQIFVDNAIQKGLELDAAILTYQQAITSLMNCRAQHPGMATSSEAKYVPDGNQDVPDSVKLQWLLETIQAYVRLIKETLKEQ